MPEDQVYRKKGKKKRGERIAVTSEREGRCWKSQKRGFENSEEEVEE